MLSVPSWIRKLQNDFYRIKLCVFKLAALTKTYTIFKIMSILIIFTSNALLIGMNHLRAAIKNFMSVVRYKDAKT